MTRGIADLVLGCLLALRGGREGWTRLALTAVGVSLGVAVLLLAASVPAMLQTREDRANGRAIPRSGAEPQTRPGHVPDADPLFAVRNLSQFRNLQITGFRVQAQGPNPPRPPGVSRVPGPGEIVLSPALTALLSGPDKELVRPRFPERVVGTIGPAGLVGPNELVFYAGAGDVAENPESVRVFAFGPSITMPPRAPAPFLPLLVVLGAVCLLVPVVIFLAGAVRLASQARDRRLAAIRLVGASSVQVRRIAVGEVFVGAVAGVGVGVAFFLLGRSLSTQLTSPAFGNGFYAGDIRPAAPLTAVVLLTVPALAVVLTLFSLRRTLIEPLGVVRQAPRSHRRLWWRLVPLLAGGALLVLQLQYAGDFDRRGVGRGAVAGIGLLLVSVAILLPWLVERTVRALGGRGTPAWQLAVRRLQVDTGSSARIVAGVATAVAGGIALQALFIPAQEQFDKENPDYTNRISVDARVTEPGQAARLESALRSIDGVRLLSPVVAYQELTGSRDRWGGLYVAPCPVLRRLARLESCSDGDAYQVVPQKGVEQDTDPADRLRPGEPVRISTEENLAPVWTVPNDITVVESRRTDIYSSPYLEGILATPRAVANARIPTYFAKVVAVPPPALPDAVEHIRNAAAPTHWSTAVTQPAKRITNQDYALIRSGLFLGSLVVLVLVALSLLVVTLDQLRERRRSLAMLAAGGVRRSVLVRSVLWQATIPTVLALVVALGVGLCLARLLLLGANLEPVYDWPGIAALVTAALGAVLLATALTLPALRRVTVAAMLRTE